MSGWRGDSVMWPSVRHNRGACSSAPAPAAPGTRWPGQTPRPPFAAAEPPSAPAHWTRGRMTTQAGRNLVGPQSRGHPALMRGPLHMPPGTATMPHTPQLGWPNNDARPHNDARPPAVRQRLVRPLGARPLSDRQLSDPPKKLDTPLPDAPPPPPDAAVPGPLPQQATPHCLILPQQHRQ